MNDSLHSFNNTKLITPQLLNKDLFDAQMQADINYEYIRSLLMVVMTFGTGVRQISFVLVVTIAIFKSVITN